MQPQAPEQQREPLPSVLQQPSEPQPWGLQRQAPQPPSAQVPKHPNDRSVLYRLVDIFEPGGMFDNRDNPSLFASSGSFAGNSSGACGRGALSCRTNAAHAPWAWDDSDDKQPRGALALDPARLVKNYFSVPEPLSTSYSFNPYR